LTKLQQLALKPFEFALPALLIFGSDMLSGVEHDGAPYNWLPCLLKLFCSINSFILLVDPSFKSNALSLLLYTLMILMSPLDSESETEASDSISSATPVLTKYDFY